MANPHEGMLAAAGRRFAIVAARFNDVVVDQLVEGALEALQRAGANRGDVVVVRCPGALEIAAVARRVAETGKFDGIVCLGAVIRGDTAHFDVVVNESARGVSRLAETAGCAVANGILTCDTVEQAMARAGGRSGNKGFDAAMAAVETADLFARIAGGELDRASAPVRPVASLFPPKPRLGHLPRPLVGPARKSRK